mgnify:CR=1 FL=1
MKDWGAWVALIGVAMFAGVVMLALAAVGEPQSEWLMCDIIGLEICQ